MNSVNVYFSDFFNVDEDVIESYGAINISLINIFLNKLPVKYEGLSFKTLSFR